MSQQNAPAERTSTRNLLLIWAVFLTILFVATFYYAWTVMPSGKAEPSEAQKALVAERIKPVARVNTGDAAPAQAVEKKAMSGEEVYNSVCMACHATGVLNAPKLGDKDGWAPRIAKGEDTLLASALNGLAPNMPAKGGNAALSEDEIKGALAYMLDQVGVKSKFASAAPAAETAPASVQPAPTEAQGTADLDALARKLGNANNGSSAAAKGSNDLRSEDKATPAQATDFAALVQTADPAKGKPTYDTLCMACHMTGTAGAPLMGNKEAWAPRIAQGMEVLVQHSIQGFNAMPPKGGNLSLSDADMASAVAYMVQQNQ